MQVYDRDLRSNDFMGSSSFPLYKLELDKWGKICHFYKFHDIVLLKFLSYSIYVKEFLLRNR